MNPAYEGVNNVFLGADNSDPQYLKSSSPTGCEFVNNAQGKLSGV